jgi:hypothetical protein
MDTDPCMAIVASLDEPERDQKRGQRDKSGYGVAKKRESYNGEQSGQENQRDYSQTLIKALSQRRILDR